MDYGEEEIVFVKAYKEVDLASVKEHFIFPPPHIYSFYRFPDPGPVILIWTRNPGIISSKGMARQRSLRLDMLAIAEKEGIKIAHVV